MFGILSDTIYIKFGSKWTSEVTKTINRIKPLMAGDELDDDAFLHEIQEIHFDSKEYEKKFGLNLTKKILVSSYSTL